MALTSASLKTKIVDEMEILFGVADVPGDLADFAEALAKAIVDEITTNADVTVTGGSSAGTYPVD